MDNEYYILESGERAGPFTARELMNRPLEPDDVVLLASQTQGVPAHSMPEFSDYFKLEGIYYPTKANTGSYFLRLPAFIIDYFIIVLGVVILGVIFFPQYVLSLQPDIAPGTTSLDELMKKSTENMAKHQNEFIIIEIVVALITILYNAACEAGRLRGSVGKYVMGLAVVDEMGYALTFGQALKRNAGKLLYTIMSFVINAYSYLFYLRIIWGERHQAMHDQFAGCFVVKKSV
jgi:uncharacterized RDD family membrane protein YckC